MSLEVRGGGSVAVSTESLREAERSLHTFAAGAGEARAAASSAAALAASAPGSAIAMWALRLAQHELAEVSTGALRLSGELRAAAEAYGWAERVAVAQQQLLARLAGPQLTVPLAVTALAVASARAGALDTGDETFIAALRAVADSVDYPVLLAVARALPGPAFEETPVRAVPAAQASVPRSSAPSGFGELADRVPESVKGAAQVRVERYLQSGGDSRWVVYVSGTSEWSPVPGDDAWDLTSNATGLAGEAAGSTRATVEALKQAGWKPGEPVLPVGHSQGGIVATALTMSGLAPVPMLVTLGSPTAGLAVPLGVVGVAVEHRDDPVPAVGGSPRFDDSRLVARATAPHTPDSDPGVLAGHSLSAYRQTARELDDSTDTRLAGARNVLAEFTGGQQAEVTMWLGKREPQSAPIPRPVPGPSPEPPTR